MLRRQFLQFTAMGGAAIGISGIGCLHHRPGVYSILEEPSSLMQICNLKTLKEIGKTYRLQTAAESYDDQLISLLLTDTTGKTVSPDTDKYTIQTLMFDKVNQDFEKNNTVVVKGWVLSLTEARQCALLFVNNP
jgi:hypothetical protein